MNPLTQNIVWQLHAKDLRRDMNAWSDQRLRDFARSFDQVEKRIQQAYLAEVDREWQRRSVNYRQNLTQEKPQRNQNV